MSAWQAIRFLSLQTTCRIGSTPACAIAIAQATLDAWACAAVLSVAFMASTHCAISAIRSLNTSSVPPSIAGASPVTMRRSPASTSSCSLVTSPRLLRRAAAIRPGRTLSRPLSRLAHDEVPASRLSTGGRSSWKCCRHASGSSGSVRDRSSAFSQTQRISGFTSQWPFSRTPPHGPFRNVFGQVIGQVIPVSCRTHWPHMRQPKTGFLNACSMAVTTPMRSPAQTGASARRCWSSSLARLVALAASAA